MDGQRVEQLVRQDETGRGPIVLAPEEPWTGRVAISLSEPGTAIEIRVLLFRNAEREPYRSLNLIVDAVAPS